MDFESENTTSELNLTHYEQAPASSSSEHISTVTKSLKFELEVSKALSTTCILLFQYTLKFLKYSQFELQHLFPIIFYDIVGWKNM